MQRGGITGHAAGAAVLAFGHQAGAFEHGDVLLHRGERHAVVRGQLAHRGLGVHHAGEDVAPGGVGQCAEQPVQRERGRLLICNHMVVDIITLSTFANALARRAIS